MINLFNNDCFIIMDILIKKGIKFDAIITDPPYNKTACKWDKIIPINKIWDRLNKLIKNNGVIALFGQEPFSSKLRLSNLKNYKYDWIWNKDKISNFMSIKRQPGKVIENIIIFNINSYNPQMTKAVLENKRPRIYTKKNSRVAKTNNGVYKSKKRYISEEHNENLRYPKNIINIKSSEKECNNINRVHPTQKPIKLMEYLIKTYTQENELVLDFTMGSGSTGVACKNLNRSFIGIEKEKKYFDIACKRMDYNADI